MATGRVISAVAAALLLAGVAFVALSPEDVSSSSANEVTNSGNTELDSVASTDLKLIDGDIIPGIQSGLGLGWDAVNKKPMQRVISIDCGAGGKDCDKQRINLLDKSMVVPKWAQFIQESKFNSVSSAKIVKDQGSKSDSMSLGLGVSGGYGAVSGEASVGFEQSRDTKTSREKREGIVDMDEQFYTLKAKTYKIRNKITGDFKEMLSYIRDFDVSNNNARKEAWRDLFSNFGTHVITQVSVGGQLRMVANYLESGSEDQQKSSLSAAASATYGAGGGDAPAPAPAPGGDGGGGIEGPSVSLKVNFGSSQETATKEGLKDVSVSFACTGGDPSICKNKNAGTQKYLESIKDNPEMFESSVVPISRAVPSDLRNEARQQIDLFFKELGEQCPTKVAGKICSGNGMCMTNKDWAPAALSTSGAKCHCNAGQTGNACELKMVGTLETGKPYEVKFIGRGPSYYLDACKPNNRLCWNLQNAPGEIPKLMRNGGCDLVGFDLPEGVEATAFNFWSDWGPGCNNWDYHCMGRLPNNRLCWAAFDSVNAGGIFELLIAGKLSAGTDNGSGKGDFLGFQKNPGVWNLGRNVCAFQLFIKDGYGCPA